MKSIPIVAAEIEFYLTNAETDALWQRVRAAGLPIAKIEKERGEKQYEIALAPDTAERTGDHLVHLKNLLAPHADFSAKPFANQPGSGLHIHVHLEDETGKRLFYKHDAEMSDALKFAIGGLLARMKTDMPIFAPSEDSKKRFVAGSNAPMTISWGANNRTTAIRLPDSDADKKRIEHRVAGADADPKAVIAAILRGIEEGIANRTEPPPQIYGDASLEMYGLAKLVP